MCEEILAGILGRTDTARYIPSILTLKDTGVIVLDAHPLDTLGIESRWRSLCFNKL